jgi:hypothetical protein
LSLLNATGSPGSLLYRPLGPVAGNQSEQVVTICNDEFCRLPISDATVLLNGLRLLWNPANQEYEGNQPVAPGAPVDLQVTSGGSLYGVSTTQFTQFPTLLIPAAGMTWDAGVANTMTWSPGASASGAINFVWISDSTTNKVVYPTGAKAVELPLTSTSYTIPPNWTVKPGNYNVGVGIGTPGIGNGGAPGLPISNAAPGSGLTVGGVLSVQLVHVF